MEGREMDPSGLDKTEKSSQLQKMVQLSAVLKIPLFQP